MKLTQIRAIFIILSFHAIFCLFYNLKNFEYLEIPKGIHYFSYKIEYSSSGKNESSFIFINYGSGVEFSIEDENGKKEFDQVFAGWLTFPLESFKENNTIYLKLRNNNANPINFFFLDYSKEINIDFETFLNWNYNLTFMEPNFVPIPIIFNIDTVTRNSTVLFTGSYQGKIINDIKILYYCLKIGNQCTFKELTTLNAIKGNKYKFKLNPTQLSNDGYYTFPQIRINRTIDEIELGRTLFEIKENQMVRYFILKNKEYSYYFYINYNYYYYYTDISEKQKKNITTIIDKLSFNYSSSNYLSSISCNSDYLLLKIQNRYISYKGSIYIVNDVYYNLDDNQLKSIEKGKYAVVRKYNYISPESFNIIVSSSKSMILLETSSYFEEKTNLININLGNSKDYKYIFIDSMEQSVIIKSIKNTNPYNYFKFNLVSQNNLSNIYNIFGPDSIFMRINSYLSDFGFNNSFIFGLDEEYYLYTKKYFGRVNIYQLDKQLDAFSNLEELQQPIQSYETNDYKLITNKLIIMSGYQIYSYFNSYGSFYDIYMQKVNDLEHVQLNQNMFKFNNLVKLFKKDKLYYLDFTVDHFIKLDSNFLNAVVAFTDKEMEYKLDIKNKVIKNLRGDNIIVKSDKDALVYFYKKIPDDSPILVKEFDKNQSGKNMFFTIEANDGKSVDITIIKDFGFIECYPIISEKNWEVKNVTFMEIITENLYDKLEGDLYEEEGEKYVVYAFDSLIKNNIPIFNASKYNISENYYIDSLFTKENKYNLEVFPPNIEDGFFLLYSKNKPYITYQFFVCENEKIQYFIFNEKENLFINSTINKDYTLSQRLSDDEILRQKIISNKESLFAYKFHNPEEGYEGLYYDDYSILSINKFDKNNILLKFSPVYRDTLIQYHIIIAKKEGSNNKDTFSNPCYLAKLLTQNSDKIVVKTLFAIQRLPLLAAIIDISKLNLNDKDEILTNIISNNFYSRNEVLTFYNSTESKIEQNEFLFFNFDETTSFDIDKRSKFKFDYINNYNSTDYLILTFESYYDFLLLYSDGIKIQTQKFEYGNDKFLIKLEKSGIYFFEFNKYYDEEEEIFENYFIAHIEKIFIDVIDLSQKQYYSFEQGNSFIEKEPKIYKVQNINEDKYVFFSYEILNEDSDYEDHIFKNPFQVCNDNTKECKEEIIIYKFEKKYNYTIYIKNVRGGYYHEGYEYNFYSPAYMITTGFENNIDNNLEEGYYIYSEPKLLFLNLEKMKKINLYFTNFQFFYYIYANETIFNKDNLEYLKFLDIHYSEFITFDYDDEKFKYVILIPIFKINNFIGQLVVTKLFLLSEKEIYTFNIPAQQNSLIFPYGYNYRDYNEEFNPLDYNLLIIYNSTLKNIKPLGFSHLPEYNNIVPRNYLDFPIYVDKSEKNSTINVKIYYPRFSFFGVIDDNIFRVYKDYLQFKFFESYKRDIIKELAPFTIRVYSDLINFNEFVNIYLSGIKEKLNIYIKKLYGPTELYECEAEPIENMNFSIITKPLSSCKNKKSIFNRLINLGGTKIFSGYLEHSSYFDGYLDFDDDNRTIELSYAYKLIKRNIKNIAKYLKKDIEYTLKLDSNYLAKLEITFDEEVVIYKDKDNILLTLNNRKLTGKLEKGNFKIKSNKGVIIYFYGELHKKIKQKKINNVKGAYVEIKSTDYIKYVVDFGFEGYGPSNLFFKSFNYDETLYFENLYDKLQTKLIEGESLYFYYYKNSDSDDSPNINIIYKDDNKKSLINPKNEYNFYLIENTDINKPLIINNMEYYKILYRINYCETKGQVKMYYQYQSNENENSFTFSEEEEVYFEEDADEEMAKLRFESNVDFVFSYSFYDKTDRNIEECTTCKEDRIEKETHELNITEITKKEKSNIYSIKFIPNYMYSSTRYIIVIAKKDDENSIETFSNLCHIAKLATHKDEQEKVREVKIINIYDIGEENYINVDIDMSDILSPNTEYIVGIISQELRFFKKLNCYKPKTFSYDIESIKMKIGEEQLFDLDNNKVYFNLSISKSSTKNEMLLLNYKLEQQSYPIIQIYGPNGNNEIFIINKQEGFINFLCDKSGSYIILFTSPESNYLRESNSLIKGTFRMISTESPFDLNIRKENIEFEEFNVDRDEQPTLRFNIKNLDKDYIKKISFENIDNSNIKEIVSIKRNNEENKNLNFHYYTFENNKNYVVTIKFQKKGENKYTFEKFNILDYSSNNIEDISAGNKTFNEVNDKFLIIKWENIKRIAITKINKEPELLISDITKSQSNNLAKEFQNIKFNKLTNFNITKPEKANYSVLMVEISEPGTKINFDIDKTDQTEEDDVGKDDGFSVGYIILISVCSLFIVIAIIFIIVRYHKKRKNIDFNKKAQEISQEQLLNEM